MINSQVIVILVKNRNLDHTSKIGVENWNFDQTSKFGAEN